MEMFRQLAGILLVHVPAKGIAEVMSDLLGGTVQTAFVGVSAAGLIKDGKVRGLAMGGEKRSPLFGDVPTFAEKGFPQMYARAWWGIVAPAGTPRDIVDKLNAETQKIFSDPAFRDKFLAPAMTVSIASSPEKFGERIEADLAKWGKVIKDAKVQVE
jgi:tripartite-type tricarboxylate transporter receptor subunit TctC